MDDTSKYILRNVRPVGYGVEAGPPVDVAIADGRVVDSSACAVESGDWTVFDFQGAFLSPAWMDVHTHVYWGGSDIAVRPSDIGIGSGVPILVDAGSAGEGNFNGFREYVIQPARERIVPLLNVGSIGLVATNRVPEVRMMSDIDIERIQRTVEEGMGLIRGLKVRLCSIIEAETDLKPLKLAKKLSRWLKLPLMVHIGRPLPLVEEVLDRLDAGDVLTHCFQGKPASGIVDDAEALAAAKRARERGVLFDIGHGAASFSYRVCREAMDRGILPDLLGSDIHSGNIDGPVWDLSMVMSKMHALGMPLTKIVNGVGTAARQAFGLPDARMLPGDEAAFTLFTMEDEDLVLPDSLGEAMRIPRRFVPRAVFWKGVLYPAASRFDGRGGRKTQYRVRDDGQ
jgi:dihydroorotase